VLVEIHDNERRCSQQGFKVHFVTVCA
jgi:hypothetical protein